MKDYLRVINLDGTQGCGKSTQAHILCQHFKRLGTPCKVNFLLDNIESGLIVVDDTLKFLQENPEGIVINDGSPARMMVMDLINNVQVKDISEKYREIIHKYGELSHQYPTANVLMVMEDVDEADRRVRELQALFDVNVIGIEDKALELQIVRELKRFDIHSISRFLKFDVVDIHPKYTINDVTDEIFDYLEQKFFLKVKKPSETRAWE